MCLTWWFTRLAKESVNFNFDEMVGINELTHFHQRRDRTNIAKVLAVDAANRFPLRNVGDKHARAHDIREGAAGCQMTMTAASGCVKLFTRLLPFNRRRRFPGYVIHDPIKAAHLVDDAIGYFCKQRVRQFRPVCRHEIGGLHGA